MKLYLAYGANTNLRSMRTRCPAARYVCNITLNHHTLVFRGVADVVPKRGARVHCALWLLTDACEKALDQFEGFPHLYVKKYVTLHLDGRRHRVMLYVMRNPDSRGQSLPSRSYEDCLRNGYHDCGISTRQIDAAMSRAAEYEARKEVSYNTSFNLERINRMAEWAARNDRMDNEENA